MRYFILFTLLILMLLPSASAQPADSTRELSLNGKQFQIKIAELFKSTELADTILFSIDSFYSERANKLGFIVCPFTLRGSSDKIIFEATSKSEWDGEYYWRGTIRDDGVQGRLVWSRFGEADIVYQFSGILMMATP